MKKPDVKLQIDDLEKQYKDGLISLREYSQAVDRVVQNYNEWLKRNGGDYKASEMFCSIADNL